MKRLLALSALAALTVLTVGCSSPNEDAASFDQVTATLAPTTTTTVPDTTTTTVPEPVTTTTLDVETKWRNSLTVALNVQSEANKASQLDESAAMCRTGLAKLNAISLAPAPSDYALADKYFRLALGFYKDSFKACAAGDLSDQLWNLKMANDYSVLTSKNL